MINDKTDEKIAIIGGGVSGLYLANQLIKEGYKHVTIYEQEARLGGKLHSIFYHGKSYEMGALFSLPSQQYLKKFMKQAGLKADGPKMSRVHFDAYGNRIMELPKEVLPVFLDELDRLPNVLAQYHSLELPYIGEVEESLTVSFDEWCQGHDFKYIKNIYAHYFTSYGLGDVDSVPAIYVLKIITYENLMSFMEIPEFSTWKNGVEEIIRCLEKNIRDIRLNQKVTQMTWDGVGVWIETVNDRQHYDKVILAAPLNPFSKFYDFDREVQTYLNQIQYQSYSVYAYLLENVKRVCGCVLENLKAENKGHLVIWHTRWELSENEDLVTVYAYDHPSLTGRESQAILREDLEKLGMKNPRLHYYKRWKQCPYVTSEVLKSGFYQKLRAMQGVRGVYFAGEIMSSLSMDNCIQYCDALIKDYF